MPGRKMIVEVVGNTASYTRAMTKAKEETAGFGAVVSKAERGALAGSGAFAAMGRSLAFASGGFLAFAAGAQLLRASFDAAQKQAVATTALGVALGKVHENASAALPVVSKWAEEQVKFGVSAADAEQALGRMVELTGSSRKAMLAYTAALEISRATGKSFNAVSLATGKAFGGQTTALARYIGHINRGISAGQLFERIQGRFGGQAAANTTQTQKFSAALSNSEEIIGTAILPGINKLLASFTKWLDKMNKTGKLQKDVDRTAHDLASAFGVVKSAIHDLDSVTGSFKNTLELLLALKLASKIARWTREIKLFTLATKESAAASALGSLLVKLRALAQIGTVAIAFRFPGLAAGLAAIVGASAGEAAAVTAPAAPFVAAIINDRGTRVLGDIPGTDKRIVSQGGKFFIENKPGGRAGGAGAQKQAITQAQAEKLLGKSVGAVGVTHLPGVSHAFDVPRPTPGSTAPAPKPHGVNITTDQRNTFFDNAISRDLNRAANVSLPAQLKVYDKVLDLLARRLSKTKDITRRLTLEDEILQVQASKKGVQLQLHQKFLDSLTAGTDRASFAVEVAQTTAGFNDDIAALQGLEAAIKKQMKAEGNTAALMSQLFQARQQEAAARQSKTDASLFGMLGLGPTGDAKVPGVGALKKLLGNVTDQVSGTILDTNKTRSLLGNLRKVLGTGLKGAGDEVHIKIASMLHNLESQLDQSTNKNIVKWKHLSSQAFLAGIPNLTPQQKRVLADRFDQIGRGGTVAPVVSAAFSKAGADSLSVHVNIDGHDLTRTVTSHQIKRNKKRTLPRGV